MFPDANPKTDTAPESRRRGGLVIAALTVAFMGASAAHAQDEATVKAGLEIWKSSGCSNCHGPFANGDKDDDEAPTGANLRTTRLDAAALKETIRCGRPGAGMPSFDEGAYKVRACGGAPVGPAPDDLYPAPRNLTLAEMEYPDRLSAGARGRPPPHHPGGLPLLFLRHAGIDVR